MNNTKSYLRVKLIFPLHVGFVYSDFFAGGRMEAYYG